MVSGPRSVLATEWRGRSESSSLRHASVCISPRRYQPYRDFEREWFPCDNSHYEIAVGWLLRLRPLGRCLPRKARPTAVKNPCRGIGADEVVNRRKKLRDPADNR